MSQLNGFKAGVIDDIKLLEKRTPKNVLEHLKNDSTDEEFGGKLLSTARENHKAFLDVLSADTEEESLKKSTESSSNNKVVFSGKTGEGLKKSSTPKVPQNVKVPQKSLPERLEQISEKINPPFTGSTLQPIRLPNIHFIKMDNLLEEQTEQTTSYSYLKKILLPHSNDVVVFFIHGFTSNSNELVARCLEGLQNLPDSVGQIYVMPISWEDDSEDLSFNKQVLKKSSRFLSLNPFETARSVIADSVTRAQTIGNVVLRVIKEVSLQHYGLVSHSMGTHAANVVMSSKNLGFKPKFNLMLNPHVYKETVIEALNTSCCYGYTPTWVICNENDGVLKRSRSVNDMECLGDVTSSPGYVYGQYESTVLVGKNFKTYIIRDFEAEVNDPDGTRHKAYNNPIMKKMVGSLMSHTSDFSRITSREIELKFRKGGDNYGLWTVVFKTLEDSDHEKIIMHQSIMRSMLLSFPLRIAHTYDFPVKTTGFLIDFSKKIPEEKFLAGIDSWVISAI